MLFAAAMFSLGAIGIANGAEVTDLPTNLRGDAGVRYDHSALSGSLVEGESTVGNRSADSDKVTYSAVFSPISGAAVFVEVPSVIGRSLSYSESNQMLFDPVANRGTMVGTSLVDDPPSFEGSGLEGIWTGVRASPFNERYTSRGNRVTWLIELAMRTAGDSFYVADEEARGGGTGGSALRARMAFSARRGSVEPYLRFGAQQEKAFTVGEDDTSYDPADSVSVDAGLELVSYENEAAGSQLALDFGASTVYRSWQTLPSGVLLPSVMSSSEDIAVTESEYAQLAFRFGVYYRVFENLQINLRSEVGYVMSHVLEHPYAVRSGYDNLYYSAGAEMRIRIR